MKNQTFQDVYEKMLADALDAENQLTKALPKMAKAASSEELRDAFEEHLSQTREHVSRIEQIFDMSDSNPKRTKCKAMQGLIEEGEEVIKEIEGGDLRDVALIGAAQKVEHYEIASYGTLRTMASLLEENDAGSLIEETLNEEKETDQKLTQIADNINPEALEGESTEEGEEEARPRTQKKTGKATSRNKQRVA